MRRSFQVLCPTMIAVSLFLGMAVCAAGDSHEEGGSLSGTYDVTGFNPDGSAYDGVVEIAEAGQHLYRLKWTLTDVAEDPDSYEGQGALLWRQLFVVWGEEGADCRAFLFEVAEDGTLSGDWFSAEDLDRRGWEEARPVGKRPAGMIEGRYKVAGKDPSGNEYETKLKVSELGSVYYEFRWQGPGETLEGIGELDEDYLVVVQKNAGHQCGRMTFDVQDDGRLEGTWRMTDSLYESVGHETAVRRGRRAAADGSAPSTAVD